MSLQPKHSGRKSIAILFPAFFGGGAEAVALWMIAGLKDRFDVTLVTFSDLHFDRLNATYGTCLSAGQFSVEVPYAGTPLPRILMSRYNYFTARQHLLLRHFKRIKDRFELAIGAFNEMDMGRRGIQYLHAPMFGPGHEQGRALLGYPDSPLRRLYHRLFERVSGFSAVRMRNNVSIANSQWSADLFHELYGMDIEVLYPPVKLDVQGAPWNQRENGFVCIARIVPEKNIEAAIEIIGRVRQRGFDVHLHLISSSHEPGYRAAILKLQAARAEWLFLNESISRAELARILSEHRYGIHPRENEQFGISVAEMVQAGCIPFVPSRGGPTEIVDHAQDMLFGSRDEAVDKICAVLSSEAHQQELASRLRARANLFSVERFQDKVRGLVDQVLSMPAR